MANTLKIKRGAAATIPQGELAEPLFTTDTYDLYIGKGSGGNQRFQKYIASGTSSQFLKGDGTLDSTSYQPLITAGTTLQYYRGDKTFQTLDTAAVPENGAIYFTEPRVRSTVLTGLNLTGGGTIAATDSVLQAFGKVQNQISALVGGATYQGTWNANTNSPTLASGTGTKGYYYVVNVAGSTNLDGITDWKIGDWAIFNGTTWDKVDNTDAVSSVNGFTGAVDLGLDNISDVDLSSPTGSQLLRFNGTSSKWENWTPTYISGNQTITLSGDVSGSGATAITTTIGALKVTNAMLAGSIEASKLVGTDIATVGTITSGTWNGTTIAIANGGTGATTKAAAFNALSPMTTLGDIIYGGASGAGTRLAGNTTTTKKFLIQTGDGTNSAAPSWGSIAAGDVPTLNQNTTGSAATLTTARTLTIGATGKTFDGSANVSWSLAEIGAEPTLIKGNLTETTSSVLTITGGTGAVIGSGTTIAVASAGAAQAGVVTTGAQTLAGAKTLDSLLTGTQVAMTASITSGAGNTFSVTQTQRNGTDTGDTAISASHSIVASSPSNQLVIRAMSFGSNNNLTGGGTVANYRVWNVASSTQTGTTTTNLDQIYIEKGTSSGTVTNSRAILINNMQGSRQGAFVSNALSSTDYSYVLLGTATIPDGKWGIYQFGDFDNNYFAGDVLIKTTTDAGYALDVNGTARLGALSGTSATFSGDVAIGLATALRRLHVKSGAGIAQFESNTTSGTIYVADTGTTTIDNQGIGSRGNNIAIMTGGADRLTIASTGAATFSSSVTIQGGNGMRLLRSTNDAYWQFNNDANDDLNIGVYTSAGVSIGTNPKVKITESGNVGIGTSSPNAKLHIQGTGAVLNAQSTDDSVPARVVNLSSNVSTIGFQSNGSANSFNVRVGCDVDNFVAYTNNTERMRITSDGYVAIVGNQANKAVPYLQGMSFGWNKSNGQGESMINWTNQGGGTNPDLTFNYWNNTTLSERMRITSGGNVGIGTSTGFNQISGTETTLKISNSNAASLYLESTSASKVFANYVGASGNLVWYDISASVARMTITSGGELLINTTTYSGDYKLQVNGNTYTAGTITTHAPAASSIGTAWKFGGYTNTTVAAASGYLLVEVGGTLYYVGLVSPL